MKILIRKLGTNDMNMYRLCYENTEFKHFIYGDKPIDIDATFNKLLNETNGELESFVVLYNEGKEDTYQYVGFCNFLKHPEYPFQISRETFAFNGGILPELFNSGFGIYACVSLLKLFFVRHPQSDLYASTFIDNRRSAKMLSSMGFEQMNENWFCKNHFLLSSDNFYSSSFVNRLLSRIALSFELAEDKVYQG